MSDTENKVSSVANKTIILSYIFGAMFLISMAYLAISSEKEQKAILATAKATEITAKADEIKQKEIADLEEKKLIAKIQVLREGRKMGEYYGGDEDCKLSSETSIEGFRSETYLCTGGGVILTSQGKIVSKAGI